MLTCPAACSCRASITAVIVWLGYALGTSAIGDAADANAPGPLGPAEAFARFKVPEDLELVQVLAEPVVKQPVFLNFDERGRMWVVQYLQYPFPAGLKMQSRDKFWRAVYDKVPPPPPKHFPGKDRITIHSDTDGDGRFDKEQVFVEGLNIVTSCVTGRGGVWILNPPYLLFYPDQDGDDVPDGDPVVHLEGFGLEDTHSVVNSLRWGPDGWLYGAQGSTVTGNVKRPGLDKTGVYSQGQLIWRYHPETKRYEIFAEGGGNAFGVEIDPQGRTFSGHNGGDTRGFHYMQGAYLQKGFTKHGPLSNPYAFGFFPAMRHHSVPRFTHNFVIYDAPELPARYHGKLFGVAPMLSHVVLSDVEPDGSTFRTADIGHPVTTDDTWFRPVDIKVGPDGAIYLADWYDGQVNHFRNHEGAIDPSNGRIYRLQAKGAAPIAPFDLRQKSSAELVELLAHPNHWYRRMALRLLADRRDAQVAAQLKQKLAEGAENALELLWGLNAVGAFDEETALKTLGHANPHVRLWTVRLLADERKVSPTIEARLAELAGQEANIEVRAQLACSARRLPAADGLPILAQLCTHDQDTSDPRLPLLLWWTLETYCTREPALVLDWLGDRKIWSHKVVATELLARLMQRFAATGSRQDLLICARLLNLAPEKTSAAALLRGFEDASQGRPLATLPAVLIEALDKHGGGSETLRVRQRQPEAVGKALERLAAKDTERSQRLQYVLILGEIQEPRAVPVLLALLERETDPELCLAVLGALQAFDREEIGSTVVQLLPKLPADVKPPAFSLLASRRVWSRQLLAAVEAEKIAAADVPDDIVRKLTVHRDEDLAALVSKHWGSIAGATTAEMQEQIERLAGVLRAEAGSPYAGRKVFVASCAKCHVLFGQGGRVGPDLTAYQRSQLDTMLLSIVNPSAEIREGFETLLVVTTDGRTVSGFVADRDPQVLVLRSADGQSLSIPQDQVEETLPQKQSLMPEGLLKGLTEQQVRDLFAYLRSTQPLNE